MPPGLHVDSSAEKIDVAYEISKDNLDVIGLTLSNLTIRTGLSLSLKGEPLQLNLSVSRRDRPFMISSASGYGGAGYLELSANSAGVGTFAFCMEMGAIVKKDFGVAKGQASLMAGFYFRSAANSFQMDGYVRLNGCLAVVGIGGVDIMAYLGLRWSCGDKFEGSCEVRITLHVGPFEVSVGFTASHAFGGDCGPSGSSVARLTLEEFCGACP
jgi:hypothetical protein